MTCAWAACNRTAAKTVDGYLMCGPHVQEHLAMIREDNPRQCETCGAEFTSRTVQRKTCDGCRVTRVRELRPCGTHAAFQRHKARSEQPCDLCVAAERTYNTATQRRRAIRNQRESA